jgi:hypothetical protein
MEEREESAKQPMALEELAEELAAQMDQEQKAAPGGHLAGRGHRVEAAVETGEEQRAATACQMA